MTAASADDPMVPLLTDELYTLLTRDRLVEGANLRLTRQDDRHAHSPAAMIAVGDLVRVPGSDTSFIQEGEVGTAIAVSDE